MPGFKNYTTKSFSFLYNVPITIGGTLQPLGTMLLSAFEVVRFSGSVALDRGNAIASAKVRLTGAESFYRQIQGYFQIDKPNTAGRQYSIQVQGYYQNGNYNVDVYVINQTGGSVTVPSITYDVTVAMFIAPF